MNLTGRPAKFLFTAFWARKLNRAGFTVRAVHSLSQATVWDGAEERLIRFYWFGRRIEESALIPETLAPIPPEEVVQAPEPASYLWHDSRPPFPIAVGASRRLKAATESLQNPTLPALVSVAPVQTASASSITRPPFPLSHLAD